MNYSAPLTNQETYSPHRRPWQSHFGHRHFQGMDQVCQHPYDAFRELAEAKLDWNYKVNTDVKPTALFVKTERKNYCSSRLELGFQERFDRRAVPGNEPQGMQDGKPKRHLQNANQSTFIVRASTSPDALA